LTRRLLAWAILVASIQSLWGCVDHGAFQCKKSLDCGPEGFCEFTGACSFEVPTKECPSGRRYGTYTTSDLSDRCVDDVCPTNPVVRVRAGRAHACVVRQGGQVACWGAGDDGQLGDGNTLPRSTVEPVPGNTLGTATDIALGDRHTCALLVDGSVWCWGANDSGQLGNGTTTLQPTPTPTRVQGTPDAIAIAAGGAFTCAVHAAGNVDCWGRNADGELGIGGGLEPRSTPQPIPGLANIRTMTARDRHACALTVDGLVSCWGSNQRGELGDGTRISRREPSPVMLGLDPEIVAIAAGAAHTCALGARGQLSCWGANQLGELGDGSDEDNPLPPAVPSTTSFSDIAAAGHHTCARRDDGSVWCWGANHTGQLGEGTTSNIGVPVPVTGVEDAADVTAGDSFSCARRHDGTVLCWGDDRLGQLGTGANIESLQATAVQSLAGALSVTAGGAHTCAVLSATPPLHQATVCWGDNQAGQIGDGTRLDRSVPTPLKINLDAEEVVAGLLHSCLRDRAGGVWCWGRGGQGQLGASTLIDVVVPVAVAGLGGATRVAAGQAHSCSVQGGTVSCWGANDDGQLGDGTTNGRSVPAVVNRTGEVVEIALGGAHTCARRRDGTVACWGRGSEGQLGHGDLESRSTPVVVANLADAVGSNLETVVGLAAGDRHTCAVLGDGRVVCWGQGSDGQLGWGTAIQHEIPVRVMGLTGAVEIAAGDNHSCARTSTDGRVETPGGVFCWGDNRAGQLGDGRKRLRETAPVPVDMLTDATGIAAGGAHTCAVLAQDRGVACWGSNSAGQLGDGAALQVLTARPTHINCP
jgi:alpha-tubulin suppressor-like RCC1 family protein